MPFSGCWHELHLHDSGSSRVWHAYLARGHVTLLSSASISSATSRGRPRHCFTPSSARARNVSYRSRRAVPPRSSRAASGSPSLRAVPGRSQREAVPRSLPTARQIGRGLPAATSCGLPRLCRWPRLRALPMTLPSASPSSRMAWYVTDSFITPRSNDWTIALS